MSIGTKATEPSTTMSLWDKAYARLQSVKPAVVGCFTDISCQPKSERLPSLYCQELKHIESEYIARRIQDTVEETPDEAMFAWMAIVRAARIVL